MSAKATTSNSQSRRSSERLGVDTSRSPSFASSSGEVLSAMHDHRIRTPNHVTDLILVKPADGLPHLADVVADATVDQVLDMIVKTFRGTILFETCAPPEQYDIDFERGG